MNSSASDEAILRILRDARGRLGPVAIAHLLQQELRRPLSHAALIAYFKRAFPEIPLPILYSASRWVERTELDDAGLERQLNHWLPRTDDGSRT